MLEIYNDCWELIHEKNHINIRNRRNSAHIGTYLVINLKNCRKFSGNSDGDNSSCIGWIFTVYRSRKNKKPDQEGTGGGRAFQKDNDQSLISLILHFNLSMVIHYVH